MTGKRMKFKVKLVPSTDGFSIQFEKGMKDEISKYLNGNEKKATLLLKP